MTGERGGYEPDAEGRELLDRVAGRRLNAARRTIETASDPAVIRAAESEIRFWAGWGIPSSGRRPVAPSGERIPDGDPAADAEPVDPPEPSEVPEAADSDYETTESPPIDRHYRGLPRPRRWY